MYYLAFARAMAQALLLILLTPLLAFTLLAFEADAALRSPDFYEDRLLEANVYAFLLNDVATAALEEARDLPPPAGISTNALNATGLPTERIVESLDRALPPGWLRAQTEANLPRLVAFAVGDSDRFTAKLDVNARVPQIAEELGALVNSASVQAILFDAVVTPHLDELRREMSAFGLYVERDRLDRAVADVVTEEWTSRQIAIVYDEAAPYITGQADSFSVHIRLDDLKSAVMDALRSIAREMDWSQTLTQQVIEPPVMSLLTDGITFTSEDLKAGLESELGPDAARRLEDARSIFRNGLEFSEADLMEPAPGGGMRMNEGVQYIRYSLAALSQAKWILLLPLVVGVSLFAALATPGYRIVWTVGCLSVISAFVFALTGPLYGRFLESETSGFFACGSNMFGPIIADFPRVGFMLCAKLIEIASDSVSAIMYGASLKAALCMAAFGVTTLAALGWSWYSQSRNLFAR